MIFIFLGKKTYPIINLNVTIVKYMSLINNFLLLFIFREPLDPWPKLAITLRHMATGATFRELMYSFRVADNTISKFIPTFLEAIVDTFQAEVIPPLIEPKEWMKVSDRFNTKWDFPHACGAWIASIFLSRPHQILDHSTTTTRASSLWSFWHWQMPTASLYGYQWRSMAQHPIAKCSSNLN